MILSTKFKAAVPSANKISNLDYDEFKEMKKVINRHVSAIRAHAKKCNPAFKAQWLASGD